MRAKRCMSILLTLVLIAGLFAGTFTVAFADDEPWNGTAAESFSGGSGTEDDPYRIADAGQLAYMAQLVNGTKNISKGKYYILTADIDLNNEAWTPIGTSGYRFEGTFDGCGYSITNLSIDSSKGYQGLFGYIAAAQVSNLSVGGEITISGSSAQYVGGITGYAAGSTIQNCESRVNISTAGYTAGGIAGYAGNNGSGTSGSRIINCANVGNITSTGSQTQATYAAGGITGSNFYTLISGCYNIGTLSGPALSKGGITGVAAGSGCRIENCYNLGKVEITEDTKSKYAAVGGIVGYLQNYYPEIENCYNAGTLIRPLVQTTSAGEDVTYDLRGGIIGYIDVKAASENQMTLINNYYVSGGDGEYKGYCSRTYEATDTDGTVAVSLSDLTDGTAAKRINGDSYTQIDGVNSGCPALKWQDPAALYSVRFNVTLSDAANDNGEGYTLTVTDAGEEVEPEGGVYTLGNGSYDYEIKQLGYETVSGSFNVNRASLTMNIALKAVKYAYALSVSPEDAMVAFSMGDTEIEPESVENGEYIFALTNGSYSYSVKAFGYEPVSGGAEIAYSGGSLSIELKELAGYYLTAVIAAAEGDFLDGTPVLTIYQDDIPVRTIKGETGIRTRLPDGKYTYDIKAKGFAAQSGEFSIDGGDCDLGTVTMPVRLSWDGETIDTSWYDAGTGTFSISSAEQLAGLAAIVNGTADGIAKDDFAGKTVLLTKDIDLGDEQWTPIGSKTTAKFSGVFNGQSFTISGLYIDISRLTISYSSAGIGLFGYINGDRTAGNAAVKALNTDGEICGTTSYSGTLNVGGIVGSANGGYSLIEQCCSDVNINVEQSGGSYAHTYAGGVAGQCYGTLRSCGNTGSINIVSNASSAARPSVGGVAGYAGSGSSNTIYVTENLYNWGTVTLTSSHYGGAGGVLGTSSSYNTIQNIYNAGRVKAVFGENSSSDNAVGSVCGFLGSTASSKVTLTNAWYLEDTAAAGVGNMRASTSSQPGAKTAEEMKAPAFTETLGTDNFKQNPNGGYPILSWQRVEKTYAIISLYDGETLLKTESALIGGSFALPRLQDKDNAIFVGWKTAPEDENVLAAGTVLDNMEADCSFYAVWREPVSYSISLADGTDAVWTVTAPESAYEHSEVTVTVERDAGTPGVVLSGLLVQGPDGEADTEKELEYDLRGGACRGVYKFSMPSGNVTLSVQAEYSSLSIGYKNAPDAETKTEVRKHSYLQTDVDAQNAAWSSFDGETFTSGTASGIKLTTEYLARFGIDFISGDKLIVTDMDGTEHTFTYDELYETRYSFASADAGNGVEIKPMIALTSGEGAEAAGSRGLYRLIVGQKSADDDNSRFMVSSVSAITVLQRENAVKFVISPEDAKLTVTVDGAEVKPQDDGSYLFPRNSTFTYTVSATRYDTETKTCRVTGDMTLTVELNGFDENRPFTDDDGYLLIGTAAELKWWNGHAGTEDKVKLTADIWLNEKNDDGSYNYEYEWPFITYADSASYLTNSFQGTFDGQGHTIYGLYINRENTYDLELSPLGGVMAFSDRETYVGFFARSGGSAVIKNMGVEGKIELIDRPDQLYADYTQVGGLVGMAEGNTSISGCWTNVAIQAKASGDSGSLGGYPYAGYPYVDDMYIGGIAGSASGNAAISDCYTQGSLIGAGMRTVHIGGIVGATRSYNQIKNCYSTASIESYPSDVTTYTSYLGGIIGTSRSFRSDNQTTYSDATIESCVALNRGITGTEGFTKYNTIGGDDYNSKRYSNNYAAEIPAQGAEKNGTRNAGEAFTEETFSTIGWSEYTEESGEGMWRISGHERPLLWWQNGYAEDLTDTYEPAPDTNSSWDGQFGTGTPPPTFTLSVQVNGYGAIEYKTYKAAELLKQANANYLKDGTLHYSSWSTTSSAGRVVRQYVYLDELLLDAGISFEDGDSFKMGGYLYTYEYLMADRYYYPGWTSGSTDGAEAVRPIIALRSYKAADPGSMQIYAGSCDYLWAYALNYGQADVYEGTYPYFVYQQTGATVMYEKEDTANSTMRAVLADVIEKARDDRKDVTAAQLVYYDRDATNEDVMEAVDALNGQPSREEEISPNKLKKDFSVYVTVDSDSVLLSTFTSNDMYTLAEKDSPLLYSSRTDSGYSSGRAVAEYVKLDELLSSAGAVWRSGDTLKMGGNSYSYDTLMAERYYYYASEPVSVPAVIALKSYGGKTASDSTLNSWLSSADYLYAYMLTYGQKDRTDATYSSFVYKQTALSVVYDGNEPANATMRLLLEKVIEEGEAAGKDVSKAREVLEESSTTNSDAMKAILAVYPDKAQDVPAVDNDDDGSAGGTGASRTGAAKDLTITYGEKTRMLSVEDMKALAEDGTVYFSAVTGKGNQVGYTNSYVTLSSLLEYLDIESFESVKFICTDGSTGTYTWEDLSKPRYDFSSGEAEEIKPMLAILSYMEYGSSRGALKGLEADSYARFRFIPGQLRRGDSTEVLKWVESVVITGAVMKSRAELPFTDVSKDDWFAEAVAYVYANGLMNGTSADKFSPGTSVTRAMIVTMLYRLEGEPDAAAAGFSDVGAGQWYEPAVSWAAANGIVNGYGDARFGPNDSISREQFAAILFRYARYKGYDISARAELNGFKDEGDISSWALDAMSWAAAEELINGVGDARLEPYGSANRAQAAVILYRFCENILK